MSIVYLNGRYLAAESALVPVGDRGFLFGDGVYEVSPAYRGRFFLMDRHRVRLARGLGELRIGGADLDELETVHHRLLAENDLADAEVSYVYVQITRGVAPRTHAFPATAVPPTVYAFAAEYRRPARERWEEGFGAVTVPDRRWARVDIKTINLLPNVLAQQTAVEAGAADALFVRDGVVLEGAHSNFFAVFGDTLVTHPASNVILHGITRGYVLGLARDLGIETVERAIQVEELAHADEAFFTGTTTEVRPTVTIDGHAVGEGRVGPVARRLFDALLERTRAHAAGHATAGAAG
jgi:D-alanine transaminase